MADSDDSDRFATSERGDAITSLVAAANMAGKAMGERDRARLALVAVTAERDAARAALGRVRALLGDHDGPLWAVRGVREADSAPHWKASHEAPAP
jgi:hypothetical protein